MMRILLWTFFPPNIYTIRHYVPLGINYIWHYFQSMFFFIIQHYVPFGVYYIQHYFQSTFSTFRQFLPYLFVILWKEATAALTALVYSGLHTHLYRGYVQVYWLVVYHTRVYLRTHGGKGGEEVRGPSSEAVSSGVADTVAVSTGAADSAAVSAGAADSAAVEALTAPPVPGVQKPPRWVGKRFRDHFAAALLLKAQRPRGAQTMPAWPRRSCLDVWPHEAAWTFGHSGATWTFGHSRAAWAFAQRPAAVARLLGAASVAVHTFRRLMTTDWTQPSAWRSGRRSGWRHSGCRTAAGAAARCHRDGSRPGRRRGVRRARWAEAGAGVVPGQTESRNI